MPDGLVDLGGGFKMVNPETFAPPSIGQQLTLQNLVEQAKSAPFERKKLEIETAIKANELLHLDVENALQRAQYMKAIGDEHRSQAKFVTDGLKQVYDLFQVDPSMGAYAIGQILPNAQVRMGSDGTATIEMPSQKMEVIDGQERAVPTRDNLTISIDPNRITPEKKRDLEGQWYDRFQKAVKDTGFSEVSRQYDTMKSLKIQATGAADLGLIFSYNKMLDPGGRVTAGEVMTATNTPALSEQIRNAYNKAIKDGGPIFGAAGSPARENFVKAAESIYQNSRASTLQVGRDMADFAGRERLNSKNILAPIGDIKEQEFMITDDALAGALNGRGGK